MLLHYLWAMMVPHKDLRCTVAVSALFKRELESLLPVSFQECGEGGFRIDVSFETLPDKEHVSPGELQRLFSVAESDAYSIASMVAESLEL